MKNYVIYDSIFGNTEQIAQAIGKSLSSKVDVEVIKVNRIKPEQLTDLGFLIIGSPTRAFAPTKEITKFLNKIPSSSLTGIKVSAFDTRISFADINSSLLRKLANLFGYATKKIISKLKKKGGVLMVPPEGFFVIDEEGPLKEGELERAVEWAKMVIKEQ